MFEKEESEFIDRTVSETIERCKRFALKGQKSMSTTMATDEQPYRYVDDSVAQKIAEKLNNIEDVNAKFDSDELYLTWK